MWRYYVFGLHVESPLALPELSPVSEDSAIPCDIEISIGKVEQRPHAIDEFGRGFWAHDDRACYLWPGVGEFLVSAGRHILVEPHQDAVGEALRLSILGPVLALALQQRGLLTLHASAVAFGEGAVAFLGGHGWGKSTMAATLHARGHPVMSDDLTALLPGDNRLVPSYPQIKLWPDAVGVLGHVSEELPLVHPDVDKRALRFSQGFAREPLPLKRLYLLGLGETVAIEDMTPRRALEELMRHCYCNRFGPEFFRAFGLKEHFLRVSHLARTVSLRRLQRPATLRDDPGLMAVIEKAILEDLES